MTKISFSLDSQTKGEAIRCQMPEQMAVPLNGHSTKTVKKKAQVLPGTLVADHPGKNTGDAHAPVAGVVTDISAKAVIISPGDVEEVEAVAPIATDSLPADELKAALKALGVSTLSLCKADTLVINGLNPEPGTSIASYILANEAKALAKAVKAAKTLTGAGTCNLVHSQSESVSIEGCICKGVNAVYPTSVDALAVKAATGKENPSGVCVMGAHELYLMGKALETGLPVTETLCCVDGKIVIAPVGAPISDVLATAGCTIGEGDSLILGGPMRGVALDNVSAGLPKEAYALTVIHNEDFPPITEAACTNCGMCVSKCPARIQPNMITRYAEFKLYSQTRKYNIDSCFECGLCGFWCTGRRPMLQYIRLAKQVLAEQDAQTASCALNA